MNYLFFDIECANCFEGVGKMCSFGYVLTNEQFEILETDDIVMNPDCEFDWYLYKKKNDIKLAYSQEVFRSRPNFPNHYGRIRDLVLKPDTTVFGFSSLNDIGFVVSACERYNLPTLFFSAYDLERIIKSDDEIFGSLEERCKILKIDNSDLQAHKSSDDAIMTMRLLKAYSQKINLSVEEIMKKNENFYYSTKKFIKTRSEREQKKIRKAKFAENQKRQNNQKRFVPKTGKSLNKRRGDSRVIKFD